MQLGLASAWQGGSKHAAGTGSKSATRCGRLHLSRYLLATGDLVATSKQAGHATTQMTEAVYLDVLKKYKATIDLPKG